MKESEIATTAEKSRAGDGKVTRARPVRPLGTPKPRHTRAVKPEAQKTVMLHVRIEEQVKAEATAVFDAIGISVSEALRVFLKRVVSEKAFPFRLEVPNAATRAAMEEARSKSLPKFATVQELFDDLEKGDAA